MSASLPQATDESFVGENRMQPSTVATTRASDGPIRIRRAARPSDPLGGTAVDHSTAVRIQRSSGGVALPALLRRTAELQSGRDLGGVRVHRGSSASEFNDQMQASAFTVGRNIFLGGDSAHPGSPAGDRLLAHEIGHVVEEGGGATIGRVRRETDLRPLDSTGTPTVRRLFGSEKKKRQKQEQRQAALQASVQASAEREAETHPHFAPLKSAVAKVEQCVARLRTDPLYDLTTYGPIIMNWCREISAQFEGAEGDPGFGPLKARLRIAIDDVQIMYDHEAVAITKRMVGEKYMEEGSDGNLKALSADMKAKEFAGTATGDKATKAADRQAAGKALGLTRAEQAAITVFTGNDYKYINPATKYDRKWQLSQREVNLQNKKMSDDQYVTNRNEEGSLHAALAIQGLQKLPVWAGSLYRGESFTKEVLDQKFKFDTKGRLTARNKTVRKETLSSNSKHRDVAEGFLYSSAIDLGVDDYTTQAYGLMWEFSVTNGRDIELLSDKSDEYEVATFPGAEFKVVSITRMRPFQRIENVWLVKAVQVK